MASIPLAKVDATTLDIDDLADVSRELLQIVDKWRFIACCLGLAAKKDAIEAQHRNLRDCLHEVLTKWLNQAYNTQRFGLPSWRKIVEVVYDEAGGDNPSIASEIARKHAKPDAHARVRGLGDGKTTPGGLVQEMRPEHHLNSMPGEEHPNTLTQQYPKRNGKSGSDSDSPVAAKKRKILDQQPQVTSSVFNMNPEPRLRHCCDKEISEENGSCQQPQKEVATLQEVLRVVTNYKDCVDYDGYTPLHEAAENGREDVVRMLLSNPQFRADISARDNSSDTALNVAALNGCAEVVGVLISEFGSNPSVKGFGGRTPLHQACDGGHLDVVVKLVSEHHCDVTSRDDDGCTPLHIAVLAGMEEVVRKLVTTYKCPINCVDLNGDTPLHCAAMKGHIGVARMLLSECGADAAARNDMGNTALNVAALNGHDEMVNVLITEFGCSPSVKSKYGRTPLHQACNDGHLNVVNRLVSVSDLNARDNDGLTPLHVAAGCGREETVRELITKYDCPVNCVDSDGDTPLHQAAMEGHVGVVRMLLSKFQADVAACNYSGNTPLHLAAMKGNVDVVRTLLSEFGADAGSGNNSGATALYLAALYKHAEVVNLLTSMYHPE